MYMKTSIGPLRMGPYLLVICYMHAFIMCINQAKPSTILLPIWWSCQHRGVHPPPSSPLHATFPSDRIDFDVIFVKVAR